VYSFPSKEIPILQMIYQGQNLTMSEAGRIIPMLSLFCALFGHTLFSIGDKEFYGELRGIQMIKYQLY
jgi:ubiquitin-protein ligase E3 C